MPLYVATCSNQLCLVPLRPIVPPLLRRRWFCPSITAFTFLSLSSPTQPSPFYPRIPLLITWPYNFDLLSCTLLDFSPAFVLLIWFFRSLFCQALRLHNYISKSSFPSLSACPSLSPAQRYWSWINCVYYYLCIFLCPKLFLSST